jgi:hypothetical protein
MRITASWSGPRDPPHTSMRRGQPRRSRALPSERPGFCPLVDAAECAAAGLSVKATALAAACAGLDRLRPPPLQVVRHRPQPVTKAREGRKDKAWVRDHSLLTEFAPYKPGPM